MKNTKVKKVLSLVLSLLIIMSIPVGVFASDNGDSGITPYGQVCPSCGVGNIVVSRQPVNSVSYTSLCTHKMYGHDNWRTQYYVTTERCGHCQVVFGSSSSHQEIFVSCNGYSA